MAIDTDKMRKDIAQRAYYSQRDLGGLAQQVNKLCDELDQVRAEVERESQVRIDLLERDKQHRHKLREIEETLRTTENYGRQVVERTERAEANEVHVQGLLVRAEAAVLALRKVVRQTQYEKRHHKRVSCNCDGCTSLADTEWAEELRSSDLEYLKDLEVGENGER